MRFEFATATKILFGAGTMTEAGLATREYGDRVLLVSGSGKSDASRMSGLLDGNGMEVILLKVEGEPDVDKILQGLEKIQNVRIDVVVAFGGGSTIDAAKAIAALAVNPGEPLDYLEVVGRGKPIGIPGLPVIAIPTTAGTGSEVTRNAVLGVPEQRMKVSLRSPYLLPKLAIIDPELCISMPPAVTASTGMDALAQVIEPFVSSRCTAFTDLYCTEGMLRVGRSLLAAYCEGENLSARADMSFASLMGGLALANSGLGVVHGFASPLGGMFNAPHGAICARLLAPAIQINFQALEKRLPEHAALGKYVEAARLVTGSGKAEVKDLVDWLAAMCAEMKIPTLSALGIRAEDIPAVVVKAASASSTKANPIQLLTEEMTAILEMAL